MCLSWGDTGPVLRFLPCQIHVEPKNCSLGIETGNHEELEVILVQIVQAVSTPLETSSVQPRHSLVSCSLWRHLKMVFWVVAVC